MTTHNGVPAWRVRDVSAATPATATTGDRLLDYAHSRLVGVFDSPSDVRAVTDDLTASGLDGAFDVHRGAESAERIDFSGTEHGPLARVSHALHTLTVEGAHMEHYKRELLAGHSIVMVLTKSEAHAGTALRVFEAHRARFINQFGFWSVETVRP
jgi:hypothetical protein